MLTPNARGYDADDVKIIEAIARFRAGGYEEAIGFTVYDTLRYREALEPLVRGGGARRCSAASPARSTSTVRWRSSPQASSRCASCSARCTPSCCSPSCATSATSAAHRPRRAGSCRLRVRAQPPFGRRTCILTATRPIGVRGSRLTTAPSAAASAPFVRRSRNSALADFATRRGRARLPPARGVRRTSARRRSPPPRPAARSSPGASARCQRGARRAARRRPAATAAPPPPRPQRCLRRPQRAGPQRCDQRFREGDGAAPRADRRRPAAARRPRLERIARIEMRDQHLASRTIMRASRCAAARDARG